MYGVRFVAMSCLIGSALLCGACGEGRFTFTPPALAPGSTSSTGDELPPWIIGTPRIDSISPAQGPDCGGAWTTLTGRNFASGAKIRVGGVDASDISVWSSSRITARLPPSPAASGRVPVTIHNPDGQEDTSSEGFLYYDCPTTLSNTLFDEGVHVFVVAGDFDRDGRMDLVVDTPKVGSVVPTSVNLLLNDRKGGFKAPIRFSVGTTPRAAVVGDWNGDQKTDLAVVNADSNNVSVLLGDGVGGFNAATNFATGNGPVFLEARDVNHDETPDLITINKASSNFSVLLGDGAGGFGPATNFATASAPNALALGDVNGDGHLDLATGSGTDKAIASVHLGDGTGAFGSALAIPTIETGGGSNGMTVVLADMNGDQNLDLIVGIRTYNAFRVFLGDGQGAFGESFRLRFKYLQPNAMIATDWNHDQKTDLIVSGAGSDGYSVANGMLVLLGNGAGGIAQQLPFYIGTESRRLAVADMNGDENPDFVSATDRGVIVLLADGKGGLLTASRFSDAEVSFQGPYATGDWNGDQNLDLMSGTMRMTLGDGNGGIFAISTTDLPSLPLTMIKPVAADFNMDGKLDVAIRTSSPTANLSVLLGDGRGNFGSPINAPSPTAAFYRLEGGDWNSDGKPDLVVLEPNGTSVVLLLGDGRGNVPTTMPYGLSAPLLTAVVADLNADGKPDLAVGHAGSIAVMIGNGAGGFSGTTLLPITGSAGSLTVSDLNADRRVDLAYVDPLSPNVVALFGDGLGGFPTSALIPSGTDPRCVVAGDLNGDLNADLIVTRWSTKVYPYLGTLSVMMSDGRGGFGPPQLYSSANSTECAAVGDFNGDKKSDLVLYANLQAWMFLSQTP